MYFKILNRYSWLILLAYLGATFSMQLDSHKFSFEAFLFGLSLILIMVYWSEYAAPSEKVDESKIDKIEVFLRDLFLISYSLMLGDILSLLFQYDNSDMRGWWTFFLYFSFLCNVVFAFAFSLIASMMRNHKMYTIIFSCILLTVFTFSKFWPLYKSVLFLGEINTFLVIMCSLIGMHLLIAIVFKLTEIIFPKLLK
ncbi:conserved membrane protein of unknown function [Legionella hackeliae]|uniref:Uncharacterized protein n=2 Tax=Legionella hackeliae TaxID=449 RepID=A0A0A8USV4_LEGHA|nr:hypothetical protein Lhac_0561 [Legionella hackeliae]CEK10127.1 conserved membrane protein of unknown function [Legionella hackeliae]